MPNWVGHDVVVTGPEHELARFLARCFVPDDDDSDRCDFSFEAVVPLADRLPRPEDPDEAAWLAWGTPREAFETDICHREPGRVRFKFLSASRSPLPVFMRLGKSFPTLSFDITVLEDDGEAFRASVRGSEIGFDRMVDPKAAHGRIYGG
jgi:hypothetical protein